MYLNINVNNNTIREKFPKQKECEPGQVLYRVTFGYKSQLSGDNTFPVTYENFEENFQHETKKVNAGDLVKYTPENKNDPNYGRNAIVTKATNIYKRNEPEIELPEVVKYDIKFINPIVGANNEIMKIKKNISIVKNGTTIITKVQNEVEFYTCSSSFTAIFPNNLITDYLTARNANRAASTPATLARLRVTENALWNTNFQLDDNNQPKFPLMSVVSAQLKSELGEVLENMVNVGFLLGQTGQRPKIKKVGRGFTLSFLMPKGSSPGDTITVPVNKGNKKVDIVIQIPIVLGNDRHSPEINEYLLDVPITQELNGGVYDNLHNMGAATNINTKFKPTYIKASEYIGPDTQKDLDMLIKPGEKQEYLINNATIKPAPNGDKFIFKELSTFNKEAEKLVFDIYVVVDLTLELKMKGPDDPKDDSLMAKAGRNAYNTIMNGSQSCPSYMTRARKGASSLFSSTTPADVNYAAGLAAANENTRLVGRRAMRVRNTRSGIGIPIAPDVQRRNIRVGGGKKKKTRKKRKKRKKRKTRKVKKMVIKCWGRKTKKGFKNCWKRGNKKYKSHKSWKKATKKLKSCKRKSRKKRKKH